MLTRGRMKVYYQKYVCSIIAQICRWINHWFYRTRRNRMSGREYEGKYKFKMNFKWIFVRKGKGSNGLSWKKGNQIYVWLPFCLPRTFKSPGIRAFHGPEGNRTPVRKPIPCSSTIIVCSLKFPPASGNRHPGAFSSFILRPCAQSFAPVVSHIKWCRLFKVWVPWGRQQP